MRNRSETEKCQHCGDIYGMVYHVPDELWEDVTGISNGSGLLCLPCFDKAARGKDIFVYWEGAVGGYPKFSGFPRES